MRYIHIIFIIIIAISCKDKSNGDIPLVLFDSDTDPVETKLSDLVSEFDIIKLETNDSVLVGPASQNLIDDNFLLVGSIDFVSPIRFLSFDRKNGTFLRELGRIGRGPGEHFGKTLLSIDFMEDKDEIIACFQGGQYQVYSISGEFKYSVSPPKSAFWVTIKHFSDSIFFLLGQMSGVPNQAVDSSKVIFFNRDGQVLRTFPRYSYPRVVSQLNPIPRSISYRYKGEWMIYFEGGDTLYHLQRNRLDPVAIFTSNKKELDLNEEITKSSTSDKVRLNLIMETSNSWIVRKFVIDGIESGSVGGEPSPYLKEKELIVMVNKKTLEQRPIKIVDDLTSILPEDWLNSYRLRWQDNGIIYIQCQASDLLEVLTKIKETKPGKIETINSLQDLTENDNPIIFIFKLKNDI